MMYRKSPGPVLAGIGLVALLGALSLGRPCHGQAAASILDALPSDTTLFVRVRSGTELGTKVKASPFYALKDHPDVKGMIDQVRQQMQEGLSEAKQKLGFDPMDVFSMMEGEAVIAVGGLDRIGQVLMAELSGMGGNNVRPGDIPIIIVVDAGPSAPKLRESLEKVFAFAQKEGAKRETADFKGGKLTTLMEAPKGPPPGAAAKDGAKAEKKEAKGLDDDEAEASDGDGGEGGASPDRFYFGEQGSRFLFGFSRPYVEKVMANLAVPAADGLTKTPEFASTHREIGAGDASMFINFKPIMATARKTLQSNPFGAMGLGIVEKFLGRGLRNMGMSVTLRESDLQQIVFVNNGGGADGLFGILKGQPFNGRPGKVVPADADQFSTVSLNFQALYIMVKEIYGMAAPLMGMMGGGGGQDGGQGPPDLDQLVEAQFQVKMPDLMASLGNLLHVYQKGGQSETNPLGDMVLALELRDEMPLKNLLSKLMAGTPPQKYLDRDFYPLGGGMGGPDGMSPALALADKHLIVGVKADSVKEAVRRAGKGGDSIADTPAFQALGGRIPGQVTGVTYASPKAFKESMKMMKKALEQMSPEKIPDPAILGDLSTGSIGYSLWKPEGLYAESILGFKKGTAPK